MEGEQLSDKPGKHIDKTLYPTVPRWRRAAHAERFLLKLKGPIQTVV